MRRHLCLGISLDDAGAHRSAWRLPGAADGLSSAERLVHLAQVADRGLLDFVSLGDRLDPPPPGSARLPVRMDALLAMARIAPVTTSIGLVATVVVTHTEPFHVSKNIATLDLVSGGRGGWQVGIATTDEAARRFGRTTPRPLDELWAEAEDAIEVVARLWDSWEDDAVIRDAPTGRYIDREKLHYVDFEGPFFSVRGPSITPRPPQGQPIIVIDATGPIETALAARRANIVIIDASDRAIARARRDEVRQLADAAGRNPDDVTVLVAVQVGEPELRRHLDEIDGGPRRVGGLDLVDTASAIADELGSWYLEGVADGFLVRPDALPTTVEWFVDAVVPGLRRSGVIREQYEGATLRDRLGLSRPANRYATDVLQRDVAS